MKKALLLGSVLGLSVFVIFSASTIFARADKPDGKASGHYPLQFLEECAAEIGLSKAQLDKISTLHDSTQKEAIKLQADKKILRIDLRNELKKEVPDKNKVSTLVDKINQIDGQLKKSKIMTHIETKALMTPEQIAKIREVLREKRGDRRDQRMDRRMERNERMESRREMFRPDVDDDFEDESFEEIDATDRP